MGLSVTAEDDLLNDGAAFLMGLSVTTEDDLLNDGAALILGFLELSLAPKEDDLLSSKRDLVDTFKDDLEIASALRSEKLSETEIGIKCIISNLLNALLYIKETFKEQTKDPLKSPLSIKDFETNPLIFSPPLKDLTSILTSSSLYGLSFR